MIWRLTSPVKKFIVQDGKIQEDGFDRDRPFCSIQFVSAGASSENGRKMLTSIEAISGAVISDKNQTISEFRTNIVLGDDEIKHADIVCRHKNSRFAEITIRDFEDIMGELLVIGATQVSEGPSFSETPGLEFLPKNYYRESLVFEVGDLGPPAESNGHRLWKIQGGKVIAEQNFKEPHCILMQDKSSATQISEGLRLRAYGITNSYTKSELDASFTTQIQLEKMANTPSILLYCRTPGFHPLTYNDFDKVMNGLIKVTSLF